MMLIVFALLVFLSLASLAFVLTGDHDSLDSLALKRLRSIARPGDDKDLGLASWRVDGDRRARLVKALRRKEKLVGKATTSISARLSRAGLDPNVATFWAASCSLSAIVFGIVYLTTHHLMWAGGAGFAAGMGLPRWWLDFLGNRRLAKFTAGFADAIDLIVRGIRTGMPVHDSLRMISRECDEPISGEFRKLMDSVGLGLPLELALDKMYNNMPTPELRFFTVVLIVQNKTGGNLAEALSNLSNVLRTRRLMREKIQSMSSEFVASAFIIGSLPPGVGVLLAISNPKYIITLFSDPRGQTILVVSLLWMAVGIFAMRQMIDFKF